MADILNVGKTALNAAQIGISVTGHNIANAATPGYSRQRIVQETATPQSTGFGFVGQGTSVSQITRQYNEILVNQVHSAQSASSSNNAYLTQISQIDNVLADASAGLSPSFQQFFASIQGLASDPGNVATRQAVISSAEMLVNRFSDIGGRLQELRNGVNSQLTTYTEQVTSYAAQVAKLNDAISKSLAADSLNGPNDLMDKRDDLVSKMNAIVRTSVEAQDDGTYNLMIGNGIPLVVGSRSYGLTTVNAKEDPSRLEVAYVSNITTELSDKSVTGGALGGMLQFRKNALDITQNQLGQIATVFAATFNAQHQAGFDSAGTAGAAFFQVPQPESFSHVDNSIGASLTTNITDASALTTSNYRVERNGADYTVTRLSDRNVQTFTSLPQTVDGISIDGSLASGDSFLVKPTQSGATALSVLVNDVDEIAASDASGGSANNRNALLLADLQNTNTINNGSMSYENAFSKIVSAVGNKTNELKVTGAASDALLVQVQAAQQSESGVNLDEEAANLLRYQQAYQAAGKVMQIASKLFDVLISLG